MDRIFLAGEQVIAISEDDDKLALRADAPPMPELGAISHGRRAAAEAERTLIIGWNQKAAAVIRELDQYVAVGSEVVVLCDREGVDEEITELSHRLKHQQLHLQEGETTSRGELDAIEVGRFDHVIVLCNPALPIQQADAQTLITLLHLRAIVEKEGFKLSIVSEMMDLRNRALAEVAKADDFIVSDKLVSLLLSQLSENRQLNPVFRQLFSADGAEVYIRPISDYVRTGVAVDFYTLLEAAAQRGETAIGYRLAAQANNADASFGVTLNPKKDQKISFGTSDRLVVLAED
jgi:hypothetical protein